MFHVLLKPDLENFEHYFASKVMSVIVLCKSDLNQISYDYTAEVMNRFKGLDLVDRVPEKLWTEHTAAVAV